MKIKFKKITNEFKCAYNFKKIFLKHPGSATA